MAAPLLHSVTVSPDQSQFFRGSTLTLRCDDTSWMMLRATSRTTRERCGESDRFTRSDPWCKVRYLEPRDSGQYWCESTGGATSEPVHITVADRGVVLQMPVRPVSSGKSVSLSCRHNTKNDLPARFYKAGRLLSEQPSGRMTLQKVAPSDGGLYECEINGERSVPGRLHVLAESVAPTSPAPTSPSPPSAPPASSAPPSLPHLLVPVLASVGGLVLIILLVLLVLLVRRCSRKKTKGSREKKRRRKRPQDPTKRKSRNQNGSKICPKCKQSTATLQPLSPRAT